LFFTIFLGWRSELGIMSFLLLDRILLHCIA